MHLARGHADDPRHAEDGHDGIARVFLDGAAEGLDLLAHLVEEGRQHGAQLLGVVPGGQLGRSDKIGEQHGDGFALVGGGSHAWRYASIAVRRAGRFRLNPPAALAGA